MKILYKFASRSRPSKFFACLDNIIENALHDDYLVVCALDSDDVTMNNPAVIERIRTYKNVIAVFEYSQSKVHAINRNIGTLLPWKILCNHSDDMWFTKKGFDLDIIAAMKTHFPDTDGLLHFPDGTVNEKLVTYSIMGRKYYDRFGYIYHPDYQSVCADNEQMAVAQKLKKYVYVPLDILEHRHPAWGKAENDDQYRFTESFLHQDARTLAARQAKNYGL